MSSDDNGWLLDGDTQVPPRPKRQRRRPVVIGLLIVAGLLALVVVTGGLYAASVYRALDKNLQHDSSVTPLPVDGEGGVARPPKKNARTLDVLIVGSDDRGNGNGGRSDALMLVHVNAARDHAYIVSFPRDLYVPIPGHGKNKINAAFAFGGTALTMQTLEGLTGTRIDHAAQIDMQGFIALTDDLGGVTVNNAHYSKSGAWEFPVGRITISGEQALAYVRERKQLPGGDLDRAERQRAVVQAMMKKALSPQFAGKPGGFLDFIAKAARSVTVDDSLTGSRLMQLALSMRIKSDDISTLQVPVSGLGTGPGGMSIVLLDQKRMPDLAKALQDDSMEDYLRTHGR